VALARAQRRRARHRHAAPLLPGGVGPHRVGPGAAVAACMSAAAGGRHAALHRACWRIGSFPTIVSRSRQYTSSRSRPLRSRSRPLPPPTTHSRPPNTHEEWPRRGVGASPLVTGRLRRRREAGSDELAQGRGVAAHSCSHHTVLSRTHVHRQTAGGPRHHCAAPPPPPKHTDHTPEPLSPTTSPQPERPPHLNVQVSTSRTASEAQAPCSAMPPKK
jgi:hypothetical protein